MIRPLSRGFWIFAILYLFLYTVSPALASEDLYGGEGGYELPVDYGSMRAQLIGFGIIALVVFVGLLATLVLGVRYVTDRAIHTVAASTIPYTRLSFATPMRKMGGFANQLPYILINPVFWAIEAILIIVYLVIIWGLSALALPAELTSPAFIVGGLCAFILPSIYVILVWLSDVYEREPFRFVMAMVLWGGSIAIFLSFFINTTLTIFFVLLVGGVAAESIGAVLVAPVVEETLKGMGVLILSRHREMDGVFDGIVYAFCVGLGFAMVENWLYFSVKSADYLVAGDFSGWLGVIKDRSLYAISHGCFTAATGAMIGYMKVKATNNVRSYQNYDGIVRNTFKGFLIGLPIAMLLHALWNGGLFEIVLIPIIPVLVILGIYLQRQIKKDKKNKKLGNFLLETGHLRIPIFCGAVIKDYHIRGWKSPRKPASPKPPRPGKGLSRSVAGLKNIDLLESIRRLDDRVILNRLTSSLGDKGFLGRVRRLDDRDVLNFLTPGPDGRDFLEVVSHPNDPGVLGLKNLSGVAWSVQENGGVKTVQTGQAIKIMDGMTVQAGDVEFIVHQ